MRRLAVLLLLATAATAAAQPVPSPGEGRPLLSRRISWLESGGNPQNWTFAQSPSGHVYVANTDGVLEHDGSDWRLYQTEVDQQFLIHSVAVGQSGRVYAGGIGDVGVLIPDARGTLHYRSLAEHIAPADRDFTDVWTTHATPEGIVFQSAERLFRWNGRRMEAWRTATRFRTSFLVGGRVVVWEDGVGLKRLGARGLALLPGGAAFADRKVDALVPDGSGMVAIVRDEGLVAISASGRVRDVPGPASDYLRTFRPYAAVAVPDRYAGRGVLYAVGTFGGGVALITPRGDLVRVYREDVGLTLGDDVLGLMPDAQGGLWVALQNGIARIDLFPRLSWFGEPEGLLGSPNALAQHDGGLYVGTDIGLFRRVPGRLGRPGPDDAGYSRFLPVDVPVDGLSAERKQIWDLASTRAGLVVARHDGMYTVQDGRVRLVRSGAAYTIMPVTGRDDLLWVGTDDGVVRLVLRGGQWTEGPPVDGIAGETRFVQEDAAGAMWIGQSGGSLYRVGRPQDETPAVQAFGPAEGLSVSPGPLSLAGGQLLMASREGLLRVRADGGRVRLSRVDAGLRGAYSVFAPGGGEMWTFAGGHLRSGPGLGFEIGGVQPNDIVVGENGVAWVAASDGLMRVDPRVRPGRHVYPATVRRVTDRDLRVLFGGASGGASGGADRTGLDLDLPIAAARGLRFEFAAALFDRPGKTEFSTRLLGADDETWGPWTRERVAQFIGIREGTYTFEVRARDDLGHASTTAAFRFRILPPWYRTWWAYGFVVLALAGSVWGVTAWRLRTQRLRLDAARARNQRMQRLGARLKETNGRLRRADKLKDDLLANTSHELRTPLTAILGFSEMLLDEADGSVRELAVGIQRGGQRLLDTVNALLDMFKLQAGTADVFPEPVDAALVVRECVRTLAPLAERAGLTLAVLPEGLAIPAELDRGALERILSHVVGNAIRFTPHGHVAVLVDATDHAVSVSVRDTGIGIPAALTETVFEPFEQVSTGYARSHEGNGLGLSIVRGLAEMLGGTVTLESEVGTGTTVRVEIPRWAEPQAAVRRPTSAATNPALGGAQILAVGLGADAAAIRTWLAPQGTVCAADSVGQGVREAKKVAYDAVFVAGAEADADHKRVRLLRGVPGYATLPLLRVGPEPLADADLAARGFTDQLALPLGPDAVVTLLEALLMTVEEAVDD